MALCLKEVQNSQSIAKTYLMEDGWGRVRLEFEIVALGRNKKTN